MKTKLYNAKIATLQNDHSVIDGEIWVDGATITYIGPPKNDADIMWDHTIDVQKNLLLAGFKNAHSHSGMTFLRSYADDLPLMEWLQKAIFPMEAKLQAEHVYLFTKLAIMEYLTSGITANFDMYFFDEQIAQAAIDTGFKTVLVGAVFDDPAQVDQLEARYQMYRNYHPNISYCLGFHAEYTTNDQVLTKLAKLAKKLKAPIYAHNSETKAEVAGCIERHGVTPTVYMNQHHLFEHGGGGYHCVHLTDEDRQIFADKGLSLVTNPAANLKLASGIADIHSARQMGINIAIGTDGPAGNNALDMFREMFLVSGLAKVVHDNAALINAYDVLQMATKGSAQAMGLTNCDCLAVGKSADIIMIDLQQPNMQPQNNILNNVVYSGSKSNIKMTMINGIIRYQDGQFNIGCQPDDIYTEIARLIKHYKS